MRRRDAMDPEVERELAALEAALAGETAEPELAEFVRAVRAERPAVSGEFGARLDERVAAGFGRAASGGRRSLRIPRRALMPALGVAASVLVALVVVASLGSDDQQPAPDGVTAGRALESAPAPSATAPASPGDAAGLAPGRARRVERQASLVLAAPGDEVPGISDGVVRATDEVGGIVVSSTVSSGDAAEPGATFQLRVPARRLDDALARLSKLAHVRSRTQSSQDVTGSFVSARERLDEALAERRGLLRQLARAETPNETASLRERLRIVRGEISSARGALRRVRVRTDWSSVSVSVVADGGSSGGGGGSWTPGDAVSDAVRVLEVFAGVLVVSLAVLAPLALLGLLLVAGGRAARRRRRDQALSTS